MLNKNTIFIILLFFLITLSMFFIKNGNSNIKNAENNNMVENKIKVAVCPTFYDYNLSNILNNYETIKTSSTAESLNLLSSNLVDYVLAGRKLKPNEENNDLEFKILENIGYSFLSNKINSITTEYFDSHVFYTDLDLENIKKDLNIKNIQKVDNIYDYLDNGIIITLIENTDYSRANLVHVLDENNNRLKLSRTPILYNKK